MTQEISTIGFTEKGAEKFFGLLETANVRMLVDVRLNTTSQLAGFAKQSDLAYFLKKICSIDYQHCLDLAPTKLLLDKFKKDKRISWSEYEYEFLNLIVKRQIERKFSPEMLDGSCLLCSEHKPHNCHRRLVAEYLKSSGN